MIKGIIFDCFGVLTSDVWLAFCDGLPDGADVAQASAINRAYDRGFLTRAEFETGIEDAVGVLPPFLEDMADGQMVKNQPLLDYIRELKPHYKISILSNIYSTWITDVLLDSEDQALFDDMVLSYEVGMTKPDSAIYKLACDRLGILPAEAVMVDDRLTNVEGALGAGLNGILYEGMQSFRTQLTKLLNTNN